VLNHRNFNPRQVEWLAAYTRVNKVSLDQYRKFVSGLLENPTEIWRHSFLNQISATGQSLLLALWSLGGEAHYAMLEPAWAALHDTRRQRYGFRSEPDAFRAALKDLEGSFLKTGPISAEFLNPSVKDFLNSVVGESVDQASDFLNSLRYVTQLRTLWALRDGPLGLEIRRFLTSNTVALKAAKLFSNPVRVVVHHEQDGALGCRYDVNREHRVDLAVAIAVTLHTDDAWRLPQEEVQHLVDAWGEGDALEVDGVLSALDRLDEMARGAVPVTSTTIGSQLAGALRLELLKALRHGTADDFYRVVDLPVEPSFADWSPSERRTLQLSFTAYLRDGLSQDKSNCSDDDDVEALADMLEEIADNLGHDVDDQVHSLRDRVIASCDMGGVRAIPGSRSSVRR
jgi:hypothetical protein